MFKIFHSNKLNILLEFLIQNLTNNNRDVFSPFNIVIQVSGLKKWLMLKLADSFGIASNINFFYPNAFIDKILGTDNEKIINKNHMLFEISTELVNYKKKLNIDSEFKAYKISKTVSDVFEQYFLYRPEIIETWLNGKFFYNGLADEVWQKEMLNSIKERTSKEIITNILRKYLNGDSEFLESDNSYHFFSVSNIPPVYYSILKKFSENNDLFLYFLNPSDDPTWFETKSDSVLDKIEIKSGYSAEDTLYFDKGNTLLTLLGNVGKNFLFSVSDILDDPEGERKFVDYNSNTLLGNIQNDILHNSINSEKFSTDKFQNDFSVEIHSAHSALREVEVLYNRLLTFFEADSSLKPEDILVMAPDINEYSPYINAVFATKTPYIPYSVADRIIIGDNVFVKSFFDILDLRQTRFEFSKIFEILSNGCIRKKFNLEESDIERLKLFFYNSGVRWGLDSDFKKSLQLNGEHTHTWKFGIERLILGTVMANNKVFAGIKPVNFLKASEYEKLGCFLEFFYLLSDFILNKLNNSYELKHWALIFTKFLERMFYVGEEDEEFFLLLSNAVNSLNNIDSKASISSDFIVEYLRDIISNERSGYNFLDKGITFCELIPMRSIPFKIVYILGMNEDRFPRKEKKVAFDLMEVSYRVSDRNVKNNDRYLFLETLLSVSDKFCLSFIGKNNKNNEDKLPSVILSEFIDYIKEKFGERTVKRIFFEHKLHNFSPCYFRKNGIIRNYSESDFSTLEALLKDEKLSDMLQKKVNNQISLPINLSIDELIQFLTHPVKYFLNKNLEIYFEDDFEDISDSEPFNIEPLTKYKIEKEFLLSNNEDNLEILKMEGILPHGCVGYVNFKMIRDEIMFFKKKLLTILESKQFDPIFEIFNIGDIVLSGKLNHIYKDCKLGFVPAKLKGKHLLKFWVEHLFLNFVKENTNGKFKEYPCETYLLFKDCVVLFEKIENSDFLLKDILNFFLEGNENIVDFNPNFGFEIIRKMQLSYDKKKFFEPLKFARHKIADIKEDRYYSKIEWDYEMLIENSNRIFYPLLDKIKITLL